MILMTQPTWEFLTSYRPGQKDMTSEEAEQEQFFKRMLLEAQKNGFSWTVEDFTGKTQANKPVSPLFMKKFKVPLIDDTVLATDPARVTVGMWGIPVQTFEVHRVPAVNEDAVSLDTAADMVEKYYGKM
jgi:hypothetical protein